MTQQKFNLIDFSSSNGKMPSITYSPLSSIDLLNIIDENLYIVEDCIGLPIAFINLSKTQFLREIENFPQKVNIMVVESSNNIFIMSSNSEAYFLHENSKKYAIYDNGEMLAIIVSQPNGFCKKYNGFIKTLLFSRVFSGQNYFFLYDL